MYSWLFSTNSLPQCLVRCIILLLISSNMYSVQIWIHSRSFNRQLELNSKTVSIRYFLLLGTFCQHTRKYLESRYGMNLDISLIFCGPLGKTGQYLYQLTLKFQGEWHVFHNFEYLAYLFQFWQYIFSGQVSYQTRTFLPENDYSWNYYIIYYFLGKFSHFLSRLVYV